MSWNNEQCFHWFSLKLWIAYMHVSNSADPIISTIQKYKKHTIQKLGENAYCYIQFQTCFRERYDIHQSVDSTKAFQKGDILPKILKAKEDICSIVLTSDVNRCIANGTRKIQEITGKKRGKTRHGFADACMILQNKFLLRSMSSYWFIHIIYRYIYREGNGLRLTSLFKWRVPPPPQNTTSKKI